MDAKTYAAARNRSADCTHPLTKLKTVFEKYDPSSKDKNRMLVARHCAICDAIKLGYRSSNGKYKLIHRAMGHPWQKI